MAASSLYGNNGSAKGNSGTGRGTNRSDNETSGNDQSGAVDPRTLEHNGGDGDGDGGNSGTGTGGSSGTGGGGTRNRPGRKPGQKSGSKNNNLKDAGKSCEVMLAGIHQMLAMSLEMPELVLDDDEAAKLGQAVAYVQSFYPNSVLDPRTAAWASLAVAIASVEGPRIFLIAEKLRHKKRHKKEQENNGG